MTWLLKLYPPRWQHRYGDEFRALIRGQPQSFGNTIDVIAGAIDAWIHPQIITTVQTATAEGETMPEKAMNLRCAGNGPETTKADQKKSIAVMLSATIVLSIVWMWLHVRTHGNAYVDSFSLMPMFIGWLLSLPYTTLKARSRPAQAIFVAVTIGLLVVLFAAIGWITAR